MNACVEPTNCDLRGLLNPRHYFILPNAEAGDAVFSVYISGDDKKPIIHLSADAVVDAMAEVERWKAAANHFERLLNREREKIYRLMTALGDEMTGR